MTRRPLLPLLFLLVPTATFAQGADAPAAEALFAKGREAMAAGDYETACPKLAESQRLDPAAGTLLNLAKCEEKRGRLADAWQRYRELSQSLPSGDDRAGFVRAQVDALAKRVPKLTIRLDTRAPADTSVTRDGVVVARASHGERLPVNPGEHVIVVSASGRASRTLRLDLRESEERELDVAPGEAVAAPASSASPPASISPPAAPPSSGSNARMWGVGLMAGGGGALGVGIVTGVLALRSRSAVKDHCDAALRCDDEGLKASGELRGLANVSTLAVAVGLVAIAVGGTLYVTASPREVTVGGRF